MNGSLNTDYAEYFFPGIDGKYQVFLASIRESILVLQDYLDEVHLVVCAIGIFPNIFHMTVLTRKSMRVYSINTFLTGICLCDMTRMLCIIGLVSQRMYTCYEDQRVGENCNPPPYYTTMILIDFFAATGKFSQQCAVWFAVAMAVIRLLVIKHPFTTGSAKLTKTKVGCQVIALTCSLIAPFWLISYYRSAVVRDEDWVPPEECHIPRTSFPSYDYKTRQMFKEHHQFLYKFVMVAEGVLFKLAPSLLLPILSGWLIFELRKVKVAMRSVRKTSGIGDRATKLVAFITLSFFISIAPLGLLYLAMFFAWETIGLVDIIKEFSTIFTLFQVFMGCFDPLLCYLMSVHYRETAKTLLNRRQPILVSNE